MTNRTTPSSGTSGRDDPRFSELSAQECEHLLARSHVGRIAYSLGTRVDIEPIGYVFENGWLFGRTAPGTKLEALGHRPWVAFEVDEVHGPLDWESVVVHGSFRVLEPGGSGHDGQLHERALALLRSVDPSIGTETDTLAFRSTYFGVHIDEMTGRRARSGPASA